MAQASELKWPQMSGRARMAWFGKFLLTLMTCGFAYPNIMDPHIKG